MCIKLCYNGISKIRRIAISKNTNKSNLPKSNLEIKSTEVRLVDENGEMIGVVSFQEALTRARKAELDLVEIVPNAKPPVCKIMDFGKFKYEQKKRQQEAKKKQKTIQIKELKFRPNIGENDYQVKFRSLKKFIEEGDKVKITLRFRGREIVHADVGKTLFDRLVSDSSEFAQVETHPKLDGKMMLMVLVPMK